MVCEIDGQEVKRYHPGDYFGEAALINESRRGATVTSQGDLQCFYLDRDAFSMLFTEERLHVQVLAFAISASCCTGSHLFTGLMTAVCQAQCRVSRNG